MDILLVPFRLLARTVSAPVLPVSHLVCAMIMIHPLLPLERIRMFRLSKLNRLFHCPPSLGLLALFRAPLPPLSPIP